MTPPIEADSLLDAYDQLIDNAEDLTGAALRVAPAAARQVFCAANNIAGLGIPPTLPGQGGRPDPIKDINGLIARACDNPFPYPGPPPPPYEGGQCDTRYDVNWSFSGTFSGDSRTSSGTASSLLGPLGDVSTVFPDAGGVRGVIGTAGGPATLGAFGGAPNAWSKDSAFSVTSVVRRDGLPDDCGNPPVVEPPRPPIVQPPSSPPIPRVDPDGNPLPPIVIAPRVGPVFIDVDGAVKIPVVVNFGGDDIDVSIPVNVNLGDFAPEITIGGSGGREPSNPSDPEPRPPAPTCCPPEPTRETEGEPENPDEDPSPDESGRRRIGVIVRSSRSGSGGRESTIFTAEPPLLVPRIATVQFEVATEDGDLSFSADTQVKQLRQYVAGPPQMEISRAFIKWEPGWGGSFSYVTVAAREPNK